MSILKRAEAAFGTELFPYEKYGLSFTDAYSAMQNGRVVRRFGWTIDGAPYNEYHVALMMKRFKKPHFCLIYREIYSDGSLSPRIREVKWSPLFEDIKTKDWAVLKPNSNLEELITFSRHQTELDLG